MTCEKGCEGKKGNFVNGTGQKMLVQPCKWSMGWLVEVKQEMSHIIIRRIKTV
jgi:hypothetical protein